MIPKIGTKAVFTAAAAIQQRSYFYQSSIQTSHRLFPEKSSHVLDSTGTVFSEGRSSVASTYESWASSTRIAGETNLYHNSPRTSLNSAAASTIPLDLPHRWAKAGGPFTSEASRTTSLMIDRLLKVMMVALTLGLNILDEKRVFLWSRPLQGLVSRFLFWPTLPNVARERFGSWVTSIDKTVVLGGAPLGFASMPLRLHRDHLISGVVNMCDEYGGPKREYRRLGIRQLHLKTLNHFEPSVDDLREAVRFLHEHEKRGKRVYVHCRAGNGRSAAVVFSWLLYKNPDADPEQLNQQLCQIRKVRKTLWKQPNVVAFHSWLKAKPSQAGVNS